MVTLTITARHVTPLSSGRPPTIWEALAVRLGRAPTDAEAAAEVRRIMREAADAAICKPGRAQDRALNRRR
jgi:hypothetical protein